jgi:multidrug efflux pump subunit AcrA (membrane-fusion protein)
MPIRRTLIFFTVVALAIPFATFYFQANPPQNADGSTGGFIGGGGGNTANLQYHVVGTGEVVSFVSAVGEIEADQVVNMSFTIPGRVAEVFVKASDYVQAGDPLMRLENDNQRIAYDRAVLNLELAELTLADLTGPPDADQVRIAEANVDAAFGSYRGSLQTANPGQLQAADLQVQQAQAQYDAAVEQRIYAGGFQNEEEERLAEAAIGAASFNLEIARLQSQDLRTGDYASSNAAYLSYIQAEKELERVLAGPTDLQIEQAEARVTQAMAAMESAELALDKTQIRAPFDGFVTDVLVEPGALITPGSPVATAVDADPLSLTVQVDEIDIGQIEPGMDVRVEVDALPNTTLAAELEKIALTGQQTAGGIVNYDATVLLRETNPLVRIGMTAEANVIVAQADDVLVVPNSYIRIDRTRNEAFVQVVTGDNNIEERPVSLGLRGERFSEVTNGLQAGDIIAADLSGRQLSIFGE